MIVWQSSDWALNAAIRDAFETNAGLTTQFGFELIFETGLQNWN
jgi:hypothetical protein